VKKNSAGKRNTKKKKKNKNSKEKKNKEVEPSIDTPRPQVVTNEEPVGPL